MSSKLSTQGIFFVLVGAVAAGMHFCVLVVCVSLFGMTPAKSNILAFLLAFMVSFTGHYHLTFRSPNGVCDTWKNSLLRWFASSLLGFVLNQGLFVAGLYLWGGRFYMVIWLVVTLVIMLLTFVLGKFWAFAR